MDAYIRAGTYPGVDQLCRAFEVQPRTVHQDIKELREHFHLDIRFDRVRRGYYNANPTQRLPPIELTPEQSLLALVAVEVLCRLGGDAFRGLLAPVVNAVCNSKWAEVSGRLTEVICFAAPAAEGPQVSPGLFYELVRACAERRRVRVRMKQTRGEAKRDILANQLLFAESSWWLLGEDRGKPTRIPLDSLESIELASI
jgi:predicted DNA-binding transcriptional regulator YafY